ncbi:hypothetical protein D0A37_19585 [Microcoleus vaginatus HSN003]|nr:hypothetical protein D0A37_19585 [Microcoleus vaginatus HSN003]
MRKVRSGKPDRTILPQLFEKSAVYEPTWQNLALNWRILGLHAAVYFTATLLLQKRKDIFKYSNRQGG